MERHQLINYVQKVIGKKPKENPKLKDVDVLFQLLVRIKETSEGKGNCITCGKELYLGTADCQAGHFIQREIKKYRWDFDNCHLQCGFYCNHKLKGNLNSYTVFMRGKYGIEKVNEMQEHYRNVKHGIELQKSPNKRALKEKYIELLEILNERIESGIN